MNQSHALPYACPHIHTHEQSHTSKGNLLLRYLVIVRCTNINTTFTLMSGESIAKDIYLITPYLLFMAWYANTSSEQFALVKSVQTAYENTPTRDKNECVSFVWIRNNDK